MKHIEGDKNQQFHETLSSATGGGAFAGVAVSGRDIG